MEIQAISLEGIELKDVSPMAQASAGQVDKGFSSLLANSANSLNQSLVEANQAIEKLALGKIESTHEVVIAMEQAKMSLQIAVEVRNKLVEAYQEITKMQI